jgi:hypothetical protein
MYQLVTVPADYQNKLSRQQLVDIMNEVSCYNRNPVSTADNQVVPGDFDFVYLRFDFDNCCNVSSLKP